MENHIQKFLEKLRPAFGLWTGGLRGTLLAKFPEEDDGVPSDPIQIQSQDEAADMAGDDPTSPSTGSLGATIRDHSAPGSGPEDEQSQQEDLPQPQFTEGPSRFVTAKDGSRDCVALLVNESFLAKLRDLSQGKRDLSVLDGPLYHAKMDLSSIERLMQERQNTLETAESEEEVREYHDSMEQLTSELHKLSGWKDELEKERSKVKGSLELSRSHTQWVLETAMREADLLGLEKPLPDILLRDEEPEDIQEESAVNEGSMPAQSPIASPASHYGEADVDEEEPQRREAYTEFTERLRYLDTVQEKFDSQGSLYRENLAEYQEMAAAGTTTMSRSEFDRRKVRYGQQLTRALIDAEEEFEEARERAQALGAIGSDYGHEFYYGAEYEESWPENQIAEYNASQDWSYVEGWIDGILNSTSQDTVISVEIDEWDAEEIEVNDSISVIDYEDYRQDIDRYQRICARLEDPCPEVRWLGQPDARPLGRRGSCWM